MNILLVEDNPGDARLIREILKEVSGAQFHVECVETLARGLKRAGEAAFDMLLLDLNLPDSRGLDTLRRMNSQVKEAPIVVLTHFADEATSLKAIQAGAQDYLIKGQVNGEMLARSMRYAIERKQAEEARKRAEAYLHLQSAALEAAANGIVITDREGRIIWVNPAFARGTGYTSEEALGQNPRILKSGKQDEAFYRDLWATILGGRVWHGEIVNRRKDGSLYTEETTITPVRDGHGEISHFIAIKQDVTERKRANETLRQARDELEMRVQERTSELARINASLQKANQMKSEFLATMSHELRTPLNGIIGFSEFLVDEKPGPLNAKQKEYLGDILNSGTHLLQLINDVLDLAKVEAGKMELALEEFSLKAAVNEVSSVVSPAVKKKGLEFNAQVEPGAETIKSDRQKLKQILYNLLSNAVKFTNERGKVQVVVRPHEDEMVRIDVKDSGIGIRREDLGRLFVEFQQIDTGVDRRYQGTGLGLALTKRIVTLLNGRIEVDSQPGRGSTFSVILPRTIQQQEQ